MSEVRKEVTMKIDIKSSSRVYRIMVNKSQYLSYAQSFKADGMIPLSYDKWAKLLR